MRAMKRFRVISGLLPELCATASREDLPRLAFPKLLSPKLDGIRALNLGWGLASRYLKLIRNRQLQRKFGSRKYRGLDGELIAGDPTDPECFNRTQSIVSSRDADASGVKFYVWDFLGDPGARYCHRLTAARDRVPELPGTVLVPQQLVRDVDRLLELEGSCVRLGYEGVVLRDVDAPHKDGRWTLKQQGVVKLKRFADAEAAVLGILPRMRNLNPAKRDNLGHAKRSSRQAGKLPLQELGTIRARDVRTRVVFDCAPGKLTQLERLSLWMKRAELPGRQFTYRHQPAGAKDKPRFPRFYRWRRKGL